MKNLLLSVSITSTLIFGGAYLAYNYMPVSWLEIERTGDPVLGAITEEVGGDTLKSFPTRYNANNAQLMRMSTTSLPVVTTMAGLTSATALASIGTITTGTWNADILTVPYGGTGSSTLLANGVLYGNGTSALLAVPVGSNDQVLTLSSGVPVWASAVVDESLEYNWTGDHDFAATTTFATASEAVSAFFGKLMFSGVGTTTLDFSGTAENTASSTVMALDASGGVSHIPYSRLLGAESTSTVATTASTTLFGFTIPADTFTSGNQAVIKGSAHIDFTGFNGGDDTMEMTLQYGDDWVASTTISNILADIGVGEGQLDFYMVYDGTNQTGSMTYNAHDPLTSAVNKRISSGSHDHSATESVTVDKLFSLIVTPTNTTWTIRSVYADLNFR